MRKLKKVIYKTKFLVTPILLCAWGITITSCSSSNSHELPINNTRLSENQSTYDQRTKANGLLADAIDKAQRSDNVLMYSLNWNSMMYKYGGMVHVIKVLELNPNKEIYFFCKPDDANEPGINTSFLKPIMEAKNSDGTLKYPNFHYCLIQNWKDYWSFFEFHSEVIKPILESVLLRNLVVDFYLEDFQIMQFVSQYINSYINGHSANLDEANNQIFNNFSFLLKMHSINMIADGTTAFDNFRTDIFQLLDLTKNYWNQSTYSYPLSEKVRETIVSNDQNSINSLKTYKYYGALILETLFTLQKSDKNGISPTKYFLPGCESILDINLGNATCLDTSIKNKTYFDPYYSVNANIIDLYNSFTPNSKQLFLSSFGIQEQSQEILKNKKNVIYSGRLMHDNGVNEPNAKIIEEEATRILKLYDVESKQLSNTNLQILFKPHPRELDQTIVENGLLLQKVNELKTKNIPDATQWLKFLNHKTPMEYYVFAGFLNSNNDREVLYYAGYSTTVYMIVGAKLKDSIKKVIVSNDDMNNINKWNGYPSRVFPDGIIITNDELFGQV